MAAAVTFLDRSLRFSRLVYFSFGNYATLTALPNGATRVRLHRSINAAQGSHAFLWLPSVRPFQTHPFTLVSTSPVEFVVRAHDGFTEALHKKAQAVGPETKLRASINGPYGAPTETFSDYDNVFLVSGGSGGSFTFPLALDLIRRQLAEKTRITFLWATKTKESINWYRPEIEEILASGFVDLKVYVTNSQAKNGSSSFSTKTAASEHANIKTSNGDNEGIELTTREPFDQGGKYAGLNIEFGRPDVDSLLSEFVATAASNQRVIVGACGPSTLMSAVQKHASRNAGRGDGASVTYYNDVCFLPFLLMHDQTLTDPQEFGW
jgi:NAD(P)H-flavin reductase